MILGAELLQGMDNMHLQWFADPSGDSDGTGGQQPAGKPETGDSEAGKPDTSGGQDGSSGAKDNTRASLTQSEKLPPYSEQLEKSLREDPAAQALIREHKDANELFKAYMDLRKNAGDSTGAIRKPGDEASQEELDAFYKAIGRPDSAGEYKLVREAPEGVELGDGNGEWLRAAAHEAGLTQAQAQKVFDAYNGYYMPQAQAVVEATKKSLHDVEELAKKELGEDEYKKAIGSAAEMATKIGGDEFVDFLENARVDGVPAGNHAGFVLGMARLAKRISEKIGDDVLEVSSLSQSERKKRSGYMVFPNTPGMDK